MFSNTVQSINLCAPYVEQNEYSLEIVTVVSCGKSSDFFDSISFGRIAALDVYFPHVKRRGMLGLAANNDCLNGER